MVVSSLSAASAARLLISFQFTAAAAAGQQEVKGVSAGFWHTKTALPSLVRRRCITPLRREIITEILPLTDRGGYEGAVGMKHEGGRAAEQLWLLYFNRVLREKRLIDEREYQGLRLKILERGAERLR